MSYPYGLSDDVLAAAAAEADPESPGAGDRLRRRFAPEVAAAALTQVALRRRGQLKFGAAADGMFFTRDGLEQATRPDVAAHHAQRLVAAGARRVIDLGCGIGTDALAFAAAGLEVVAVERDPDTAAVARANLGHRATVLVGDAETVLAEADDEDLTTAVYADPARRTGAGRSWRVEDLSPGWTFVAGLFERSGPTAVKLGPGTPLSIVPRTAEAEWVSHSGDAVELGLWAGPGSEPGRRSALVWPDARLVADPSAAAPRVGGVGDYLYEPLGAVTRAGALPLLAAELGASVLDSGTPYLTADVAVDTPYATAFAVTEVFGFRPASLRAWTRAHDIGALEIKTRGLDLDPARLRRELKLRGSASATVVLTRTRAGRSALVVRRLSRALV